MRFGSLYLDRSVGYRVGVTKPEQRRRTAKQRLLEAADDLFYSEGIHTVGIDRVIAHAGVAKGSLYYSFTGKDELVHDYLTHRHGRWAERVTAGEISVKEAAQLGTGLLIAGLALYEVWEVSRNPETRPGD